MAEDTPPANNPISKEVTDEICPADEMDHSAADRGAAAEKRKVPPDELSGTDGYSDEAGGRRLKRVKSDGAESGPVGQQQDGEHAVALVPPRHHLTEDVQDAIEAEEAAVLLPLEATATAPVSAAADHDKVEAQCPAQVPELPVVNHVYSEEALPKGILTSTETSRGLDAEIVSVPVSEAVEPHYNQNAVTEPQSDANSLPAESAILSEMEDSQVMGQLVKAALSADPAPETEDRDAAVAATVAVLAAASQQLDALKSIETTAKVPVVDASKVVTEAAAVEPSQTGCVLAVDNPAPTIQEDSGLAAAVETVSKAQEPAEAEQEPKAAGEAGGKVTSAPEADAEATEDEEACDLVDGSSSSTSAAHDQLDETASKLLASGISISLIKKKKDKEAVSSNDDDGGPAAVSVKNALEVGPNISVTMVNRASATNNCSDAASSAPGRFTLSLKSQSELLDPRRSSQDAAAGTGSGRTASGGSSDTLSVSRVASSRSPSQQQQQLVAKTSSKSPMLGSHALMSPPLSRPPTGGGNVTSSPPVPGLSSRQNGGLRSSSGSSGGGGSVSEQLNAVAAGIADYMRHGIEEILRDLATQGSPEATIKGLQLELERMQWRHQQELAEVKANIDTMMKEMKANLTKESQRTIEEFKKQAEMERLKAVAEAKKKQWCANCGKEAIFYCCWNTSYCDYPCQQAHWPAHMATCSQTNQDEDSGGGGGASAGDLLGDHKMMLNHHHPHHHQQQQQQQQHHHQPQQASSLLSSLSRQSHQQQQHHAAMGLGALGLVNGMVGPPGGGLGFVMPPGMPGGMGLRTPSGSGMTGMRSSHPMGVSIRPGMPGQLTISRPYFM